MTRGEIWWATLTKPGGSTPRYHRPVLIVQSDSFTSSGLNTVLVAVITSSTRLADAPGNVALSSEESGLPRRCVVNVSELATIDKSLLTEYVYKLQWAKMAAVETGLKLVLGFAGPDFIDPGEAARRLSELGGTQRNLKPIPRRRPTDKT